MTVLTFVLKILTLILVESCFEFHMFFNCRNAVLTLILVESCFEFHMFFNCRNATLVCVLLYLFIHSLSDSILIVCHFLIVKYHMNIFHI
ncbi:unnamed protein product [Schistosoma mattheei]|uniref:Uncharacterized protein n=1 Tax=Schistosoma mattheei TaxID=31246 RepID=A0A3P8ILZ0_9TREM|nr:unnamed protein product [Schistosoma mattheei]